MSTLKADTIQNTSGGAATLTKQHAAKSWANFDGTGTIASRDSFNVASLTDLATGKYETNFTNNMDSGNFAIQLCSDATSTNDAFNRSAAGSNNTAAKGHLRHYESNSLTNVELMISTVHGDLA